MSDLSRSFHLRKYILLATVCSLIQLTEQLRFRSVLIPSLVQRSTNFWLVCQFELNQPTDDQLYSVKWYKNNEEFYRLLLTSDSMATSSDQTGTLATNAAGQQQYFPQAGVNVMMSSSNATHVRLLNASLESEGLYACEISTQNLSTIRYEKEIRVYVLPHSKLNIIGFKNRYELNDKVDLICSSDFSRPQPALAWFINGQRIGESSQWFELEAQSKSKLNEPSLFRLNLGLKFKLSPEFLAALSASSNNNNIKASNSTGPNQRNQSHGKRQRQQQQNQQQQQHTSPVSLQSTQFALSPYQLQDKLELRLQCKYKLTEVSDVTFNELVTRQASRQSPSSGEFIYNEHIPEPSLATKRLVSADGSLADSRNWKLEEWRSKRWIGTGKKTNRQREVRVSKSTDNQVTQTKSPALRVELWRSLQLQRPRQSTENACQMGSLVLLPDDPLVVETDFGGALTTSATDSELTDSVMSNNADDELEQRRRRRQLEANENSIGDLISVNCSTISTLIFSAPIDRDADGNYDDQQDKELVLKSSREASYCEDPVARRRSIISGKYSTNEEQANQRPQSRTFGQRAQLQPQLAYLSLSELARNQTQPGGGWPFAGANTDVDHDINLPPMLPPSTTIADSASDSTTASTQWPLLAPPFLEWFINNQEAPKSSARYAPELPLLRSGGRHASAHRLESAHLAPLQSRTPGGASGRLRIEEAGSELLLPSIDYTEYFANFDSRPIQQHLLLSLTLDKKHFMTPDSKLRLRCSSTQAQVLMSDSASVTIIGVAGDQSKSHGWQQRPNSYNIHNNRQQQHNYHLKSPHQARSSRGNGAPTCMSSFISSSSKVFTCILAIILATIIIF